MARILAIIAALTLSACDMEAFEENYALTQQCNAAATYGEMFGTPSKRGPCWGRTTSHSAMGNIQSFGVNIRGSEHGIALLTYRGDVLVSASVSY